MILYAYTSAAGTALSAFHVDEVILDLTSDGTARGFAEDPRIAFLADIVVIKKAVTRVRGNPHIPVSEIRTVVSDMGFDVCDDLDPGIRHESLLLAQLIGHSLVH